MSTPLYHAEDLMPALFPSTVAPEYFQVGDCVRKFITSMNVTPFIGVVTHIIPSTYKVWVQWPVEHSQESPETLVKVNPSIFGMPTVVRNTGYNSYEKNISEKFKGFIPKRVMAHEQMALRIAHTFATKMVGKLVDDIKNYHEEGLNEAQTYYHIYKKYSSNCSDYIIKSSIEKVYQDIGNKKGFFDKGISDSTKVMTPREEQRFERHNPDFEVLKWINPTDSEKVQKVLDKKQISQDKAFVTQKGELYHKGSPKRGPALVIRKNLPGNLKETLEVI